MNNYMTIDIGGTAIKYGEILENGTLVSHDELATEIFANGNGIMAQISGIIADALAVKSVAGICISTAGMVDCKQGKITHSASLIPAYAGTEIKKTLEKQFLIPCEVENDVNCAGLAEAVSGAAQGASSVLCLTVGTGIGGAFILNEKVFHGFVSNACEIGYLHLPGGAFQDLAATSVLVKKVADWKQAPLQDWNGKRIFEAAQTGDADCIRAIDQMVEVLGLGIANLCYTLNPEVVVMGGGIMREQAYLQNRLQDCINRYLLPCIAKHTRLAFAKHQNKAGLLGALYHFQNCNR